MTSHLSSKALVVITCVTFILPAFGQSQHDILQAKMEESHANLRKAVIALGEVRMASCRYSAGRDCDLAKLSDMELELLDLETKYMRAARVSASEADSERFKKIKETASELRGQISELADQIDKVGK